jgi:hypothetical protein
LLVILIIIQTNGSIGKLLAFGRKVLEKFQGDGTEDLAKSIFKYSTKQTITSKEDSI